MTAARIHYATAKPEQVNPSERFPDGIKPTREASTWTPQPPTTWARFIDWLDLPNPGDDKDAVGGYIPARLNGTRRTLATIINRTILTLDLDHATPDQAGTLLSMLTFAVGWDAVAHETFSSTDATPRYRVLVRLARPMLPSECRSVADYAIDEIGLPSGCFDLQASRSPAQFMYRPATAAGHEFHSRVFEGQPLNVDHALARYPAEPIQLSVASANTTEVEAFLDEHQHDTARGAEVVNGHCRAFGAAVAARKSRHGQMAGHLVWVLREARDGLCDARTAVDTLASVFLAAAGRTDVGLGKPRTPNEAATEWGSLLNYAVAQTGLVPEGVARARYNARNGRKP